jgi:hypothetical protein
MFSTVVHSWIATLFRSAKFVFSKVELLNLKAYSEVVDEIYYKVSHLEPWERGTRKTAGMSKFFST